MPSSPTELRDLCYWCAVFPERSWPQSLNSFLLANATYIWAMGRGWNIEVSDDCMHWISSTVSINTNACKLSLLMFANLRSGERKNCNKMHIINICKLVFMTWCEPVPGFKRCAFKMLKKIHDAFGGQSCMLQQQCHRNFQYSHRY